MDLSLALQYVPKLYSYLFIYDLRDLSQLLQQFWDQYVNFQPNLQMPLLPFTYFFITLFLFVVGSNK